MRGMRFLASRGLHVSVLVFLLACVVIIVDRFLPLRGQATLRYHRDAAGRLAGHTLPDGRLVRYGYDGAGRLARISYQRPGTITGHRYDTGQDVRFVYDAAGNVVEAQTASGVTRYAYDEFGRRAAVSLLDGKRIVYSWDPWGNVDRLTYPDGTVVEYGYDALGQIVSLSDRHKQISYDRQGGSHIVRRLPNGIQTIYERTSSGALESITHVSRSGALIAAFHYVRDAAGRVREIEERTPRGIVRTTHDYDALGRLVRTSGPEGQTTYAYDPAGSRMACGDVRYEYDSEGRLIRAGDVTYAYDTFGNLVSRKDGRSTVSYQYDDQGRLAEVRGGRKTVRYHYDGEGYRVAREIDGSVTRYVHDRSSSLPQVIVDYDGRGRLQQRYLLGTSRVGQTGSDGRELYFLEDHLGSTRAVADGEGRVVARYDYSPFGAPRLREGSDVTRFLFTGEEWDPDSRLLYLRARYYDPEVGRFLTPDPADGRPDNPQSYNLYAYAVNDPVNRGDPTGMQPWPPPPRPPSSWFDPWHGPWLGSNYDIVGIPKRQPYVTHSWWWYMAGNTTTALGRGELFWPMYKQDPYLRAVLYVIPGGGEILTINDLLYYRAHDDMVGAAKNGSLFLLEFMLQERVPWTKPFIESFHRGFDPLMELLDSDLPYRVIDYHYRSARGSRDPLEYLSHFDPVIAGSLERTRNIFFPPPGGGGGGGGLPLVGGVYLDQAAKVIGEIGAVSGAVWDEKSGRLILVGDRRTTLPPMRADVLAAALRAVYSDSPHEPGMTIDPNPGNPHSPVMLVIFFGNTENTRLGWVMFEADRVMKGYSIGRDNITRASIQSRINGYRSVTSMELADPKGDSGLWSRFWLVPEAVTARVSDHGDAIAFDPIRMRVKTETMRWAGGRLVPAGGVIDEHAEEFARHFTQHYEDYAAESPIYSELRQVTAAVAIAKWMKQRGVPVDWNQNRIFAGDPYPTPTTTPAAFSEEEKTWSEGLAVRSLRIYSFGGVEMTPALTPQPAKEGNVLRDEALAASRSGAISFPLKVAGRDYHAVALPAANQGEIDSYTLAEEDLPLAAQRLRGLPGLIRSYDSLHNERTDLGRSWSLLLPQLDFENPAKEGSESLSVENDPSTRVTVQRFVLTNTFGLQATRFEQSFVDQSLRRIGFKAAGPSPFRGVYPEGDAYRLIFANTDQQAIFDRSGRLVAMLTPHSKTLYEYDAAGHLLSIRQSPEVGNGDTVKYAYDGRGRIASITSGSEQVSYDYDADSNLVAAHGSRGDIIYRYDASHLLREVLLNGAPVVQNRYDAVGRLMEQRSSRSRLTQTVAMAPDGGRVVRVEENGRQGKRFYDAAMRLMKEETPEGATRSYEYDKERIAAMNVTLPGGAKARMQYNSDGQPFAVRDPRGTRVEIQYERGGVPAAMSVNGCPWVRYRYDENGRLAETLYEGGWGEAYLRDGAGRLTEYRRTSPRAPVSSLRFAWNDDGTVAAAEGGPLGRIEFDQSQNAPETPVRIDGKSVVRRTADGEMSLSLNEKGLITAVKDPLGQITSFTYEGERIRRIELPGGACRDYAYDAAGALMERRPCARGTQ